MPMNPMQRRARNSFLIGFLISLIIMALVVLALLYRIKSINEAYEALKGQQVSVKVTSMDKLSGDTITMDELVNELAITTMDTSQIINMDDFILTDADGNQLVNEDGMPIEKEVILKISIPKGTMVTKDMIEDIDDKTKDDQRIQEYNMILLPSQLKNGSHIDIRFQLPTGEDYIVLAKKKVIVTTQDTIWLKMTEEEILTLGNAIVETWTITGAKLYAIEYVEAGIQAAAIPTYPVSENVLKLINSDPNILETARRDLWARYNDQAQADQRVNKINRALEENVDNQAGAVQSGNREESTKIKAAREQYVKDLEGTGKIGREY